MTITPKQPDPPYFKDFWDIYPHVRARSKRQLAITSWLDAMAGGYTHEEIIAGLKAYVMNVPEETLPYVPAPAAWLNQQRWADFDDNDELAARYDAIQATKADLAARGKLHVVK